MANRGPHAVTTLREHDLLPAGTVLRINLEAITDEDERRLVEMWLKTNPDWGYARWLGEQATPRHSVRSAGDGQLYSLTGLFVAVTSRAQAPQKNVHPAGCWSTITPDAKEYRTLWQIVEPFRPNREGD